MDMKVVFPGGKRVHSIYKGFTVETDQPREEGGDGSAPEPFDLFLASIATCAGVYVVYFCDERGIDTTGIQMQLAFERNEQSHLVETVRVSIDLPPEFPAKYINAVKKVAAMCTVKRNLQHPPAFEVTAERQSP